MDNTDIKSEIVSILKKHVGKDMAITVSKIHQLVTKVCGCYEQDPITSYTTRRLIEEVMDDTGLPIASNSKGYFIIETTDEYWDYIDNLNSRIKGIEKRIGIVTHAFDNRQIRMLGAG